MAWPLRILEILLLLEELGEADDGAIYQQTPDNRHDHGGDLDQARVCK